MADEHSADRMNFWSAFFCFAGAGGNGMLLEKTRSYIQQHQLILPGETVLVGVSGGADSICLLLLLKQMGDQDGFHVEAVHVNHNLRGEESEEDQRFVREFCRERNIPLHVFSYQVEDLAKELHTGIEEAGREARKRAFSICRKRTGAQKTALAHHKNDQAETVLFRLARGSSLAGLSGIRPLNKEVIHPILFAEKEEILEELKLQGANYRTDSSNFTDHYTRNCIRRQILPVLEERVNGKCIRHIAEAAEDLAEADGLLRKLAESRADQYVKQLSAQKGIGIRQEILTEEPLLRRYILMDVLAEISGGRKDLGREQIRQLEDLLTGDTGRKLDLPGSLLAAKDYKGIIIRKKMQEEDSLPEEEAELAVTLNGPGSYRFGRWRILCELLSAVPAEIPEKTFTKWLDYDRIKHSLVIRTRRSGDYLVTGKTGGRKKLKSYFIDEKIPAEKRGGLPLLASGSRVFWVAGHRISEDCKITEQTEHVLKITISEEETV